MDNYNPQDYPPFAVTVDLAVFTIRQGQLSLLLIRRGQDPYKGMWALPGGFVGVNEDADTAARRELAEETGVDNVHVEQLKTYTDPDRDPRMRVVSTAYVALAPNLPDPVAGDDAAEARWWAVDDLGDDVDAPRIAFDHTEIINDALARVRAKLEYTTLATEFVTEPFTLRDLHRVYAAVWGTPPDLTHFRRKVLSVEGFVEPTDRHAESEGGRRPVLYVSGSAENIYPPLRYSH